MGIAERYRQAADVFVKTARESGSFIDFKMLSIAAVRYMERICHGREIDAQQRTWLLAAMDIQVVINDYWDEGGMDKSRYLDNRRLFSQEGKSAEYSRYYKDIIWVEKSRPEIKRGGVEEIVTYRERANAVSLGGVCALAGLGKYTSFIDENRGVRDETDDWFKDLWNLIMAVQVTDDQMGWIGDMKNRRPTFYTAYACAGELSRSDTNFILNAKRKEYLQHVRHGNRVYGTEPLVLAVTVVGMVVPDIYNFLRAVPGGKKILQGREKKEG